MKNIFTFFNFLKMTKCKSCNKKASYGNLETLKALYCSVHAPIGYEDVINKKCKHPNCKTRPSYGKQGGLKKDAEYCSDHAPIGYEDVTHKKCKHPNCKTRPSYNFIGFASEFCSQHKKNRMIINSLKYCIECRKKATYIDKEKRFFCFEHYNLECKELGNICSICCERFLESDEMKICSDCMNIEDNGGVSIKTKRKEISVKNFLEENSIHYDIYDKKVKGGCSKRRPDFVIETKWGSIILEVDENQHKQKTYNCHCEVVRMRQLYFDIGTEKLLIIRYNPDSYIPSYGKILSEVQRFNYLLKILEKYKEQQPRYNCSVLYMFYDGFSYLEEELEGIDPYDSKLIIYKKDGKFIVMDEQNVTWLIETE